MTFYDENIEIKKKGMNFILQELYEISIIGLVRIWNILS